MRIEGGSDLRHQVASDLAALAGIAIPNYPRLPGWESWLNPEPFPLLRMSPVAPVSLPLC
jgi:hypothetical protein